MQCESGHRMLSLAPIRAERPRREINVWKFWVPPGISEQLTQLVRFESSLSDIFAHTNIRAEHIDAQA